MCFWSKKNGLPPWLSVLSEKIFEYRVGLKSLLAWNALPSLVYDLFTNLCLKDKGPILGCPYWFNSMKIQLGTTMQMLLVLNSQLPFTAYLYREPFWGIFPILGCITLFLEKPLVFTHEIFYGYLWYYYGSHYTKKLVSQYVLFFDGNFVQVFLVLLWR